MAKPDPYGTYEDETRVDDAITQREKKHLKHLRSRKTVENQRKKEKEPLHEIEEHTNQ